jgi:hypothetical protein
VDGPIEDIAKSKGFRLSYHPTGRVHSYDLFGEPTFHEPLFTITRPNHVITISIPSADRLDLYDGSVGEQASIAVLNGQRLNFNLWINPSGLSNTLQNIVAVAAWDGLFELALTSDNLIPPDFIPAGHENHFIFCKAGMACTISSKPPATTLLLGFTNG